jgi:AcrR family transcriptional regulator
MPSVGNRVPAHDRQQQILRVAAELFARYGFEGTTTRRIAEQARINEAILFRHFPHKEDLYWAIIEQKCRMGARAAKFEKLLASSRDDRQLFATIAEEVLRRNTEDRARTRLLLFSALENHRLSHAFFRTHIAKHYERLAAHIRRRVREGVFRPVDPLLAARAFVGMVVYHFLVQELFGGARYQKFDPRQVSETLADIWLEGMRMRPASNSRNARSNPSR